MILLLFTEKESVGQTWKYVFSPCGPFLILRKTNVMASVAKAHQTSDWSTLSKLPEYTNGLESEKLYFYKYIKWNHFISRLVAENGIFPLQTNDRLEMINFQWKILSNTFLNTQVALLVTQLWKKILWSSCMEVCLTSIHKYSD